jgi:hypothetical protein
MGFMDRLKANVKDISGVGLDADEQFDRAYKRGVFLQPPDYSSAIDSFISASEKYHKDGNQLMASRSNANAALYHLVESEDPAELSETIEAMGDLAEIEKIGSQREMVPTAPLITEMKALIHEFAATNASATSSKFEEYQNAGNTLAQLGNSPLEFSERFKFPGPHDNAMVRGLYNLGLSDYHKALSVVMKSPSEAHNLMQKAAGQFQQVRISSVDAHLGEWESTTQTYLDRIQLKRHCWLCSREMQGSGVFFDYYPAKIEEYHVQILEELQEDSGMLENGKLVLCTVCGSAIEKQADRYARHRTEELKKWASEILTNHGSRLDKLEHHAQNHKHG